MIFSGKTFEYCIERQKESEGNRERDRQRVRESERYI